jgi:LysM repeat protein
MRVRNPGRYLAPAALLAVTVAVVLVVSAGLSHNHHAALSAPPARLPVTHHVAPRRAFYVIRAGDTLSSISLKTGVSVVTLTSLNPSVNPNALQTGQRLRLRR